ncbi:MAG: DUF488 domain-containing protein [Lactobacillales bacterium]|jgi:hypothetical protein|nr:DUF488 domain-containing protein [Lactobacillales bacterium]
MNKVYTIGYSSYKDKFEKFIQDLKDNKITAIVDVRSQPFSNYAPEFNADVIADELKKNEIYYLSFAKEFGARQTDEKYLSYMGEKQVLDFDKYIKSVQFEDGVARLVEGNRKGINSCLMCAEKDPIDCHRTIMVSRGLFEKYNFDIEHIIFDGENESQLDIEKRLPVKTKMPLNSGQISLGFDIAEAKEITIKDCYRKQNEKIGWSPESNEGEY